MSINIKNREADALIAELRAATGKGASQLVLELLRKEAAFQRRLRDIDGRRERIRELQRQWRKKGGISSSEIDATIGYDADGLPT